MNRVLFYFKYFILRHICIICGALIGCFAGLWGFLGGLVSGILLEKILMRFLDEQHLRKALEEGRFENIKGEFFPGALYVGALAVYCLHDTDNAVYQLKSILGRENDWYLFCRAASSCSGLNGDLLVECLASALKKANGNSKSKEIPLHDIFRFLGSAEFLWDEDARGNKPSKYLAELLNYSYVSDEISDAYRVLGLSPGDDMEKVRSAHRKLAAKFHPDAHVFDDASSANTQNDLSSFVRIQTAYETIVRQLS